MLISSIYSLNLLFSMTKPSLVSFKKSIWYLYYLTVFWRFSFSESMYFPSWNEEVFSDNQGIFSFLKIESSSFSCWSATATRTFWDLSPLILEYFDYSITLFFTEDDFTVNESSFLLSTCWEFRSSSSSKYSRDEESYITVIFSFINLGFNILFMLSLSLFFTLVLGIQIDSPLIA